MAMKEAEVRLRRTSKPEDQKYADIIAGLRALRGSDIQDETQLELFTSVNQVVEVYKSQPHTPELVTKVHQTIWQERGKLVGAIYEVPPCPYTQEELTELEQQGKRAGYLPPQLATQENRHILGKMFPNLQSHSVQENNTVTNNKNPSGWFDYEAGIDAPYLDTNEQQLAERIAKDGRELLSLNQYIVAGNDSKLFTDRYLDEKATWVRLGSRNEGRVVNANFNQDGNLNVNWNLKSDDHNQNLGGRSLVVSCYFILLKIVSNRQSCGQVLEDCFPVPSIFCYLML